MELKIMLLKSSSNRNTVYGYEAWLYHFNHEAFSLAGVSMTGRYPNSGWAKNLESDHLILIFSGSVSIKTKSGDFAQLVHGDAYHIPKGEFYVVNNLSKQEAKMWLVTSPPFQKDQHVIEGADPGEIENLQGYLR